MSGSIKLTPVDIDLWSREKIVAVHRIDVEAGPGLMKLKLIPSESPLRVSLNKQFY